MSESRPNSKLDKIEKQLQIIAQQSQVEGASFNTRSSSEIDFLDMTKILWKKKWFITIVSVLFSFLSVVYALSLPNIYRSEVLLAPVEQNSDRGFAGLATQFGGLAGLAGVNLTGGGSKSDLALEVLKSREFVSRFIEKHDLLVPIVAAKDWNRQSNELVIDSNIYDVDSGSWKRRPKPPRGAEPSMQEVYILFIRRLGVSQDKNKMFVRLSFEHYSPDFARSTLHLLVSEINEEIKMRDVAEARKSIEYLQKQLNKTAVTAMKAIFHELIEEQTKTVMFAEVRDEYVFKTIDKAVAPELKSSPKRAFICAVGAVLGVLLSAFYVLFMSLIRTYN